MRLAARPWSGERPPVSGVADADLESLVADAAEEAGDRRLQAIDCLKARPMRQRDAHQLTETVAGAEHPSLRAAAAQVLGYHRAAATFPELQQALLAAAGEEADPGAGRAIAFALRGTAAAVRLLNHRDATVRQEAVLGARLCEVGWTALMDCYFSLAGKGGDPDLAQVVLRRVRMEKGSAGPVLGYLFTADFRDEQGDPSVLVYQLFGALAQVDIFEGLTGGAADVQRTYREFWPGMRRRERRRALLELFLERLKEDGYAAAMIDALVERVARDEAFVRRHRRFLRSLLASMDAAAAGALADKAGAAGKRLDRDGIARLSDALVDLVRTVPEVHAKVQEVMARWAVMMPGLQMRAFHVQLGMK